MSTGYPRASIPTEAEDEFLALFKAEREDRALGYAMELMPGSLGIFRLIALGPGSLPYMKWNAKHYSPGNWEKY